MTSTVAVIAAGASLGLASPASATAEACVGSAPALLSTVTCSTAGSSTLAVPAGTTSVDLDLVGGGGGAGYPARAHIGGNAAEVTGSLTLPAGTAYLYVRVGDGGSGDNHGTSSGGAGSAVFALDSNEDLIAKLAIAGGGGGGAYNGDGGNAGSAGASENTVLSAGGSPGIGATGGAGGTGNYSSGGAGGTNNPATATVASGGAGGAVQGGAYGGGGGGGYAGGGGGGGGTNGILTRNVAGGGGGSSLASAYLGSAGISVAANTGGVQLPGLVAGDGQVGSASLTFDGLAVPAKPTDATATPGNHQASVAFDAPNDNGSAITSYTVTSSPDGLTATCPGSPCVVTGLTNGTDYTFTVHATNANGDSSESTATSSVTPAELPGAPTDVAATAGAGQASVSFVAPASDGGSAVTSYTVTSSPDGITATCPGSPCVVTGLDNGTEYTFSVVATNAIGDSTDSADSASVTPLDVPGKPTNVSAQPAHNEAVVSFDEPTEDGGSSITEYTVTSSPDGVTKTCSASPCTVTGLTDGTAYTFTVVATNGKGDSGASDASAAVTPASVPGAPTGVSATADGGSAEVSFTTPDSNGGSTITGYTVTSSPDGITATCPGSPCVVTGLDNGTEYTFSVVATNAIGDSTDSADSASVTPLDVPGKPTNVSAQPAHNEAVVSFDEPTEDGGSSITEYTVTSSPDGVTKTCSASPCTVTGLTDGTAYTFTVVATNGKGDSGASDASAAVTPASVPGAPTGVSATADGGSAEVSFTTPDSNGGSTITGYTVTSSPDGITATCPGSPCVVTGLDNGTEYTFTVHATSAVGDSLESAASSSVTPTDVPNSPGDVSLTPGDGQATITFPTPADNGAEITGYQVSTDGGLTWATLTTQPGLGGRTGTVTGLTNGTEYDVQVRAVNAKGTSEGSTTQQVTPFTVPGAPTGVSGTAGNGTSSVTFTAPVDDGGAAITSYTVTSHPGGITSSCIGSPCLVTGLTNGTGYTFTVQATNPAGDSVDSSASGSVTPQGPPTTPGPLTLLHTFDSAVTVSFTAPASDGGSAITGYQISTDGGATWTTVTPTEVGGILTVVATGLQPGTDYVIAVRAVNGLGNGAATAHLPVTTKPAAVDTPAAKEKTSAARVHWTESTSSNTTGYTVHASPGRATCSTTSRSDTSCVIGATAGVSYTYTVVAHSPSGSSAASEASGPAIAAAPVAPRRVPHGVPTTLTTTKGKVSSVRRGQRLTLVGSGFLPRSSVVVVVYSRPIVLGAPVTNAHGRFTQRVTVPRSLSKVRHNFMAFGVDTEGRKMRMRLSVAMADRALSHHRASTAR